MRLPSGRAWRAADRAIWIDSCLHPVYCGSDGILACITSSHIVGNDDLVQERLRRLGGGSSGREHQYDEGFGYFGAARDYRAYSDEEIGGKPGREDWVGYHDTNGDNAIDLNADMDEADANDGSYSYLGHYKHWADMKCFALGLQFNPRSPLNDGDRFKTVNDLLGERPALPGAADFAAYRDALLAARAVMQDAYGFDQADVENW
ncbi:hypothetical protein [Allohahella marinimesophila]|uniref:Uncharacterized protein n=1 Tax=Allohahella marinimesophila TaxID=1054972 RepID=A0ABP7PBM8_9GAMM